VALLVPQVEGRCRQRPHVDAWVGERVCVYVGGVLSVCVSMPGRRHVLGERGVGVWVGGWMGGGAQAHMATAWMVNRPERACGWDLSAHPPAHPPATAATWRTRALLPTRMPASAEMRGGRSVIESPM
jgi:hypothetical protein